MQIAGKRWKIDLKSRQEAGLLLSAVNLPGGIQVTGWGEVAIWLSFGSTAVRHSVAEVGTPYFLLLMPLHLNHLLSGGGMRKTS